MRYGICCSDKVTPLIINKHGFDYAEVAVSAFIKPDEPEKEFELKLKEFDGLSIRPEVLCVLVPPSIKITGPEADSSAQKKHLESVFKRAKKAGISMAVFGSGGARNVPERFDSANAWQQVRDFSKLAAGLAQENGVTIVLEHLNRKECNILNKLSESIKLVKEVDHPSFRMLVDAYHFGVENDSLEAIISAGNLIQHVHIATLPNRKVPGTEPTDFSGFAKALKNIGYNKRITIEAGVGDVDTDLSEGLKCLKHLFD